MTPKHPLTRLLRGATVAAALMLTALPAAAQDKLTVLLDWFVNPDHGPLYVALEKGFFREAGLEVELIAPADPNDPPRLVAAGKGDIAVSYQPQLPLQVEAGLPLVRFGTLIDTPLTSLIVAADSPVKSIADLKGKKVGFSVGGFEDVILGTMLSRHGLKLTDVELVNVNFSLSPALLSGQVDATIGGYRNFEMNQMAQEKRPGRAFFPEEEGVPPYDELIFVASRDRLGDPKLGRFLDAVERGTLYLVNHPDEAWQLFIKGRKDLDTPLNKAAWYDTLPRFAHAPAALDSRRYDRFAAFLKQHGLIKSVLTLDRYAVELK
ncbi:ABC transporter substrate-binding protein [Oleisolibacter albus]|uniref:ABC transporter substrate-binding protein n=1 Tax=Oleisolibacter albus TaxID=2171757 RepID=UPI001EFD246D|nr:ABC transporter substrate-binding protein [Oleisolibacter albus]